MKKNELEALLIAVIGTCIVYLMFYGTGLSEPWNYMFSYTFRQGYIMASITFILICMEIFAPSTEYVGSFLAPRHIMNSIKRGFVSAVIYYGASKMFWVLMTFGV